MALTTDEKARLVALVKRNAELSAQAKAAGMMQLKPILAAKDAVLNELLTLLTKGVVNG